MSYLKFLSIAVVCLIFVFHYVKGSCQIVIENPRPVLWKNFGFKKILIPHTLNLVTLNNNDEIYAQCASSISLIARDPYNRELPSRNGKTVKLYNVNGNCFYQYNEDYDSQFSLSHGYETSVRCEGGGSVSLYESVRQLPNCWPYTSYGIGISISFVEQIISLKSCFDFASRRPVYVSYMIVNDEKLTEFTKMPPPHLQSSFSLDKEVSGIDFFWSDSSDIEFKNNFEKLRSSNVFLRSVKFVYGGIIQDNHIREQLGGYEKMFMTVWWRNLRDGIWEMYLNALRDQSKMGTYEIYAGTSGKLIIPTGDCKKEKTLSVLINGISMIVPEYVWNLVIPKSNSTFEKPFVVIGYNSPFENQLNETKFCKDMCNEIDWLNTAELKKMRQLNSVGIIHCCESKDVISKLHGFPSNEIELKALTEPKLETLIEPEVETTTETQVEEEDSTIDPERDY